MGCHRSVRACHVSRLFDCVWDTLTESDEDVDQKPNARWSFTCLQQGSFHFCCCCYLCCSVVFGWTSVTCVTYGRYQLSNTFNSCKPIFQGLHLFPLEIPCAASINSIETSRRCSYGPTRKGFGIGGAIPPTQTITHTR